MVGWWLKVGFLVEVSVIESWAIPGILNLTTNYLFAATTLHGHIVSCGAQWLPEVSSPEKGMVRSKLLMVNLMHAQYIDLFLIHGVMGGFPGDGDRRGGFQSALLRNARFRFNMSVYEQRLAASLFVTLMLREMPGNIKEHLSICCLWESGVAQHPWLKPVLRQDPLYERRDGGDAEPQRVVVVFVFRVLALKLLWKTWGDTKRYQVAGFGWCHSVEGPDTDLLFHRVTSLYKTVWNWMKYAIMDQFHWSILLCCSILSWSSSKHKHLLGYPLPCWTHLGYGCLEAVVIVWSWEFPEAGRSLGSPSWRRMGTVNMWSNLWV